MKVAAVILCATAVLSSSASTTTLAFAPTQTAGRPAVVRLQGSAGNDQEDKSQPLPSRRRQLLTGAALALASQAAAPLSAAATYSAYTRREHDWQARADEGDIHYSSAKQLRQQLQEIAPMNAESAQLFCPNGPSAAVSPLMENRCGDRQAIPSVYGRTTDVVGNSIPGFDGGRYTVQMSGDSSTNLAAEFPTYSSMPERK